MKHDPASSTEWSLGIVIVRSEMRTIGVIITIADAVVKSVDLHATDGLEKRFSNKSRHFFNNTISVFDIEINAKSRDVYTISETLESFVGIAS